MMSIYCFKFDASTCAVYVSPAAYPGTCLPIRYDHVHRGKRDERVPTKVSVMEFGSNSDREAVFKILQKLDMKDNSGAAIVCKRAKTAMQKQRNDNLIKAEGQIKSAAASGAVINLHWEKREITFIMIRLPPYSSASRHPANSSPHFKY